MTLYSIELFSNKLVTYYYVIDDPKLIECSLYLSRGNKYKLEVSEQSTPDIFNITNWSVGKYRINSETIDLIDQEGFTMTVKRKKGYIQFSKSFRWLLNKKFVLSDRISHNLDMFDKQVISNNLLSKKKSDCKNKELISNFRPAMYHSRTCNLFICEKDNYYIKTIGGIVLSQGKWSREGNLLVLCDDSIKHRYFLCIEKNMLSVLILFGENRGAFFVVP